MPTSPCHSFATDMFDPDTMPFDFTPFTGVLTPEARMAMAIIRKDEAEVDTLLNEVDPNAIDPHQRRLFSLALEWGTLDIIQNFLTKGAAPFSSMGTDPVYKDASCVGYYMTQAGRSDVVALVLEHLKKQIDAQSTSPEDKLARQKALKQNLIDTLDYTLLPSCPNPSLFFKLMSIIQDVNIEIKKVAETHRISLVIRVLHAERKDVLRYLVNNGLSVDGLAAAIFSAETNPDMFDILFAYMASQPGGADEIAQIRSMLETTYTGGLMVNDDEPPDSERVKRILLRYKEWGFARPAYTVKSGTGRFPSYTPIPKSVFSVVDRSYRRAHSRIFFTVMGASLETMKRLPIELWVEITSYVKRGWMSRDGMERTVEQGLRAADSLTDHRIAKKQAKQLALYEAFSVRHYDKPEKTERATEKFSFRQAVAEQFRKRAT